MLRGFWAGALLGFSLCTACGGAVGDGPDGGAGETGSGGDSTSGGGGLGAVIGGSPGSDGGGTGGVGYLEPECPDVPPPEAVRECDPLDPWRNCGRGEGCYAYLLYPNGEQCAHPEYGTMCAAASTGSQGELCGSTRGYCEPGHMCVVGALGGARCGKICSLVPPHGCPSGLICGETDVQGYGVCF